MQHETTRTRIFSHITKTRWLHIEDSLEINKIRFFIGQYQRGSGAQATAYHFLDAADARPLFLDMSWGRQLDITDYKGSANGGGQPVSRVLKIKGPKDGKFWLEVQNGPGQVIGAGAVKPAGEPEASISIALTTWEARKLALAVIEYMTAWRVAALCSPSPSPKVTPSVLSNKTPMAPCNPPSMPKVEAPNLRPSEAPTTPKAPPIPTGVRPHASAGGSDIEALFGPEEPAQAKPQEPPAEVDPPTFFALANKAIAAGFDLAKLQEIIKSQVPWREKHTTLQAAMQAA